MIKTVRLSELKIKDTLQPRLTEDHLIIKDYAEAMEQGQIFPPLSVVWDGENYWLWDGYHRRLAAEKAGKKEFQIDITEGTLQDAEWLALSANKIHGFRRTNEDKRRAIKLSFECPSGKNKSDAEIADHIGVSVATVSKYNPNRVNFQDKSLHESSYYRQGRDGKERLYRVTKPSPTDRIAPEALDLLGFTDLDQEVSELKKLNRLPSNLQSEIVNLIAEGEANSVTQAKRQLSHARQAPPDLSTENRYRVFYVDPPWQYNDKGLDDYGHAERHYNTLSIDELCEMGEKIKEISHYDAVLFLWVTSPLLEESFKIINAWGFRYKTSFVWDKVKHNFGHYNSVRHEFLLVCTRGSCTPDIAKLFDSVQEIERSGKHSEKPEKFRQIIETLYTQGQKIELFARTKTEGWDAWGDEVAP